MIWLWTILLRGAPARPYNVGSDEDLTIGELASRVARIFRTSVYIAKPPTPGRSAERYIPAIARARNELGLEIHIPLEDAIGRTAAWHGANCS
jgi:dTDP-glucose 4,6-dehydratase